MLDRIGRSDRDRVLLRVPRTLPERQPIVHTARSATVESRLATVRGGWHVCSRTLRSARRIALAGALAAGGIALGAGPASAHGTRGTLRKVDHIVVVYQENHSFDLASVFGARRAR
jgi:hypothetical protein